MASDQFHIPGHTEPLQEALNIADSYLYSPERQPNVYERLKAAEERIYGYRRTALEIEESRKPRFLDVIMGEKHQRVTLKSLIEAESIIGGKPFGEGNRLWLSPKGSSLLANNNLGDWYHAQEVRDAFGRKVSETTLHFETHPTHVNKLHEGHPVDVMIDELETFVKAVELYERNIREQLYPFDQEIFDLLEEIDAENFEVPASLEDRFGKEIVARVVEAHKAQQAAKGVVAPDTVIDNERNRYDLAA